MAGTYEFWLTDDNGRRLADSQGSTLLNKIKAGTFQRVANGIARFDATFPASFDMDLIKPDRMIQVWRAPEGGRLNLWRTYFIRWWRQARVGSELLIEFQGPDVNDLIRRRIVANFTQTVGSEKIDNADDMMKEIVDEHMVNDASDPAPSFGARAFPDFTVEADTSLGTSLSKAFAWQRLSRVIPDLQRASRGFTPEVFWDIVESNVSSSSIALQFRTRINQPGADRTASIVFDEARGNLEAAELVNNWMEEENYIYAAGQGEDEFRDIAQAWDASRIAVSRYGRIEGFAFATFSSSPEAVESAAEQKLLERRPMRVFSGQAIDTEGTRFGRDWNWGDRVTARFLGKEFETIIRRVILSIDGSGREIVDAQLESIEWEF